MKESIQLRIVLDLCNDIYTCVLGGGMCIVQVDECHLRGLELHCICSISNMHGFILLFPSH